MLFTASFGRCSSGNISILVFNFLFPLPNILLLTTPLQPGNNRPFEKPCTTRQDQCARMESRVEVQKRANAWYVSRKFDEKQSVISTRCHRSNVINPHHQQFVSACYYLPWMLWDFFALKGKTPSICMRGVTQLKADPPCIEKGALQLRSVIRPEWGA